MAENTPVGSSVRVRMIVVSTYLYALTNEVAISLASPLLHKLRLTTSQNPLGHTISTNEEEWLASFICLGYMAGLIPYCYLSSKYGRKYTLLSLGVVHIVAYLLYIPSSLTCYCIGRFLNGVASSVGFIIFPIYISEICKDSDRGALLVSRQIFAGFGTLLAYIAVNNLPMGALAIFNCFFPVTFLICFGGFAVESPYFYVTNKKYDDAKKVYIKLNSRARESQLDEEIQEMRRTVDMSEAESLGALIAQKHVKKSILVVFALFIFQQLTGYIAFATYTELIVDSEHATICIGIVVLIGSTFTTCFIDKFGRKFHLLLSGAGVILVQVVLILYYLYSHHDFYLLVIIIILFFLSFNLGLAFIPQIICAEILPQRIKFEVAAVAGVFGWFIAFLITKFYLQVNHVYMISGFLVCSILQLVIIKVFVPETKKQSLRMIQGMMQIDAVQNDDD